MEDMLKMASAVLIKEEKAVESACHEEGSCHKEDELESTKAEMGEMKEENERLKITLNKIEKDYQSLQFFFFDILKEDVSKKSTDSALVSHDDKAETELVSLCLGKRSPISGLKKDEKSRSSSKTRSEDEKLMKAGLTLGLDSEFQRAENVMEEQKEATQAAGETWPPSKILKSMRREDDQVLGQAQAKRARVCVRARCDAPTMNDGCQWRKYGQKIAKGNPSPRAYYRCTIAPACPVRKQVQRCAEDMSILITTYEGTHNHPLPVSAAAMASTTSAAASILLSGSSTSQPGICSAATTTSFSTELNGLNFSLYDNSRTKQFYLPNSSSSLNPTITFDLITTSPFSSNFRFPSTSPSFSSSESNTTLPALWGNGYLNYGTLPYNKSHNIGSLNLGNQSQEQFYQPHVQKIQQATSDQEYLTETLTNAITSEPCFRSVIAAALSSMVGGSTIHVNQGGEESLGQNMKWGDLFQAVSPNPGTHNVKVCAPGYLNKLSTS